LRRDDSRGRIAIELFCVQCGKTVEGDETFRLCQECGGKLQPRWETMQIEDPYLRTTFNDKYLIARLIGRGGMSRVYEAKHLTLEKTVCIKVLATDVNLMEQLVPRFRREADAICRLNHPNIVQVIDFGQAPKTSSPYLVMEYVPGRPLGRFIDEEHPLHEKRIVHIISQVLSALAEAHAAGIIHRDLKPANIIVTPLRTDEDFVKVLDFGIAKILDEPGENKLTRTGMLFGTPEYMAPEQARGDEVDHRSDIYAIGVILYRIVTGRTPFSAGTPVGTLTKHITDSPRPPSRLEGVAVSAELEAVIMKALQKDPEKRQPDVLAMQGELQAVHFDLPAPPRRPERKTAWSGRFKSAWRGVPRRGRLAVLGGAGLLCLLVIAWLFMPGSTGSGFPGLGIGASGPIAEVQDLLDSGRTLEAEVLLNKLPEKDSPAADAVRAQILIFSDEPDMERGTALLQEALKKRPDLLDYPSVRKTLVGTLNVRNGKKAIDFLVKQAGREVVDELVQAATDRRYWLRWNSIEVLKQFKELGRVDKALVYIADLKYAASCSTRKRAAQQLAKLKDRRALEPLRQAQNRGFLANLCMGGALEDAIRQIEE
jgi:tRNA A-37 threonylcarbamoyl transferase component Bud32